MLLDALRKGFREALRPRYMLPWYLCELLLGLLQSWPVWSAGDAALRNPMLGDLASGTGDALIDLFLDNPAAQATAGGWALALIPLTIAGGLAYTFFAGGLLSVYTGRRSFWAGCRHFWWSFAGLGILTLLLALGIILIAVVVGFALGGIAGVGVGLVGLAVLNVVGEYARAAGVVSERRNPLVQLGLALRFCARHLLGVVALALLATLLGALLFAVFVLISQLPGATPLIVLVEQAWVFAQLWLKALRLALAGSYVRQRQSSTEPVDAA